MKKLYVVLIVLCLATAGAFAVTPDYFAFTIGAQGTYEISDGTIGTANPFGVQFQFDETFSAGFSFDGANTSVLNITVTPADNVNFTMYSGSIDSSLGFGAGIGYDFLVKNEAFFTSMGLYLDWLANSNAASDYSVSDGGVLAIGLKAKFGL